MTPANITLGLLIIAVGIYGVIFNKYPGKQVSYENAKKKYTTANERRITIFDSSFCILYGAAYMTLGIIPLAVLLIAYYPVRILLLKFRVI